MSIWALLLLPLLLLPTIIALKKNHPYKTPIILINILGSLFWGIGWLVALIWCFILPTKVSNNQTGIANEIEKLYMLKEKGILSQEEFELKKKELIS